MNKIFAIGLFGLTSTAVFAAPPALITSSFTKHDISYEDCQTRTHEIMEKMNLEIEDRGNGTIGGFGEQSVAIVNCHLLDKTTYVQIAVSSQKEEAAQLIIEHLINHLKSKPVGK
ncbi:hypothetical protein [Methylosoma difficile]